jgi:hypothetical protein
MFCVITHPSQIFAAPRPPSSRAGTGEQRAGTLDAAAESVILRRH